jgi:hypothetical protein
MSKIATKGFKPLGGAAAKLSGEGLLDAVGAHLAAVPPAAVERPAPPAAPAAAPTPPPRPLPFVLRLAPTVFQAREEAARRERTTMTVLIARALRDAGYPVPEEDLRDRRRRRDYAAH